jgi:putative flippase GtrA
VSSRWQRLLAEAGRFLAVGGLATLVALFLFNVLVHGLFPGVPALLGDQPIPAYVLANSVGMVVSYHGSRTYAFRDRPSTHADGGLTAFVLINVVTMLLPIACLTISRDVLGLDDPVSDNIAANVIGLVLGLAARFYLFRTFVFRRPINLNDLYLPDALPDGHEPPVDGEGRVLPGGPVSEPTTTDSSRGVPAPPSAP